MATALTHDAAGRLVIAQPFNTMGRVFGALFMLPGLKLTRDLINAIVEVTRANAWAWTDIFGFGAFLLAAIVCLVPGWLLTTIRRRVVVDRTSRSMRRVHDFLIYRWHATQSLNEFSRVRLFLPDRKNSRDKVIQFHVEFATSDKNSVLIYIDENEEAARAVAREVAAFTGLELRDDLAAADARRRRRQPQPQS